jgi:hypothetical protein
MAPPALTPDDAVALAVARSDIGHLADSYTRLSSTVERLSEAVAESRVQAAAAQALNTSALAGLQSSVAHLRADVNRRKWPAEAKAVVLAAALGAVGTALVAVL